MHAAARQQGRVQLERRVFSGRTDEQNRAAFDMRQERILLGLVEAMHLIDEQHGAAATGKTLRRLCQHLPHFRQAGEYGRDRLEFGVCVMREQQGQCRLAASRRAPQDHGVHAPRFHRAPQGAVGSQQSLLAHHLVKRARPHPLCQGPHGAAIDVQQIGCDRVGTFGFAHPFILPPAPDGRSTTQCSAIAGTPTFSFQATTSRRCNASTA